MAIQVNGTQVIGNSRELTNIASVDATTAAAIGAAGVGGGGTIDLVADGSITAGDVIGLTSAGKAKTVTAMAGSKISATTNDDPQLNTLQPFIYDSTANVFVMMYRNQNNNYRPYLMAINNSSGYNLSKGSAVDSGTDYGEFGHYALAHGTIHGKSILACGASSNTAAHAFTCSGTNITMGSRYNFSQQNNGYSTVYYDPDRNNFPHFCRGGASGINANILTTSSSSYAVSSTSNSLIISGSSNPQAAAYDTVNNKGLLLYKDSYGSGNLQGVVITNNGSSLSVGSPVKLWDESGGSFETGSVRVAYDATAGSFVITLAAGSSGTPPYAKAVAISGTTINQGNWVNLAASLGAIQGNYPSVEADGSGNFLISSCDFPNETIAFAAASGTSLSIFPSFQLEGYTVDSAYNRGGIAYSPDTGNFVKLTGKSNNNLFSYVVSGASPLPRSIGFASNSVSSGATVTVDILSGKNTSQSGLSAGVPYGVNPLTGAVLAGGTPSLGMALSSTSILVTGTYF